MNPLEDVRVGAGVESYLGTGACLARMDHILHFADIDAGKIALVKLECALDKRTEILQIAEHYNAKVVDYGPESLILQAHGSSEKLDAFIELLRPFHLMELVRSGKVLMARGRATT